MVSFPRDGVATSSDWKGLMEPDRQRPVSEYYDAAAATYHEQYDRNRLLDPTRPYPANYFRLDLLLDSFGSKGIKKVIEVGVGEGTPLVTLGKAGIDVWGFDISNAMVQSSAVTLAEAGMDATHVSWGDIREPATYAELARQAPFDGLMAMGVMPHVEEDDAVIENMANLVKPGGSVFIEFRNKLFSLFSLNRLTHQFILDDLLKDANPEMKKVVDDELSSRLRMDMPPQRLGTEQEPGYDAILSKFHNPFEMGDLFNKHGFHDVKLLWYHYHAGMPYLEERDPALFRSASIALEHEDSEWRGFFLCSAFVVEAVKNGGPDA